MATILVGIRLRLAELLEDDSAMSLNFKLRFPKEKIEHWAARYDFGDAEDEVCDKIAPAVRKRGHLTRDEFLSICDWKSLRPRRHYGKKDEDYVATVTRTALTTINERLRIQVLTVLDGVSWPTASVLLHFCHKDPYPIIDFRAFWSLGVEDNRYSFAVWQQYSEFCRALATETNVSMRTLDRALWQYSRERQ